MKENNTFGKYSESYFCSTFMKDMVKLGFKFGGVAQLVRAVES